MRASIEVDKSDLLSGRVINVTWGGARKRLRRSQRMGIESIG